MTKKILVHLKRNVLEAYEGDTLVYSFHCVTGNEGTTTPGTYKIWEKVKDYTSKKYKAPMPFSCFFSQDHKAIHGTGFALPRSWAQWLGIEGIGSHGCVGLPDTNAETIFNWASVGTAVIVN
jgi:lipoprotein-anchoring transpeptidase ErfK/SrfK